LNKLTLQDCPKRAEKLYKCVEDLICEKIRNGTLRPGARLDNADELADELGVSRGTIRHSLQNLAAKGILVRRPRAGTFVTDKHSTGYAGKRLGFTRVAALLLPDITHAEYAHLARAVQNVSSKMKIDVLISNTDNDVARFEEIINRQLTNNLYGFVMIPPRGGNLPLSLLIDIQKNEVPVVTLFHSIPTLGWPTIVTDFHYDVELSIRHLCEIGCKRIAFANQVESPEIMHTKHYMFLRALAEALPGFYEQFLLTVPQRPNRTTAAWIEEREHEIQTWLSQHPNIDGICCINDELAYEIIKQLKKLGRLVPEDVAITGFGNYAQFYGLDGDMLTTVDLCYDEIAAQACGLLQRIQEGERILNSRSQF